jgi:hypothetical protein
VLGSLSNFFLSLNRSWNHSSHVLEPGGQLFVIVGLIFVMYDSYTINIAESPHEIWDVINPWYLTRLPYQRVIADLVII